MSTLENKIKELERTLALKQAFLSVTFSFQKGNKLPEDVKDQVVNELKNLCAQLADDQEVSIKASSTTASSAFTEEEVKVLKSVAAKVLSVTNVAASAHPRTTTPQAAQETQEVSKAILISLDSVPASLRGRVSPQSTVYVKKVQDEKAWVITQNGVAFSLPVDDLDFNI